jgi:hypothetical protein
MSEFPLARTADLITETIGGEIVAYDGLTKEAHCLSALASAVFVAADGKTSIADIASLASVKLDEPVDGSHVEQAVAELQERGLLVATEASGGISRRQLMRKSAVMGGAALAAPLVTSVVTPAYGATGSVDHLNNSLSILAVIIECGGTKYRMKWSNGPFGAPAPSDCGPTFQNGGCTFHDGEGAAGCLAGTTAVAHADNTITVSFPAGCKLTDYLMKCAGTCKTPAGNGQSLPAGGASSPYTIAVSCS